MQINCFNINFPNVGYIDNRADYYYHAFTSQSYVFHAKPEPYENRR